MVSVQADCSDLLGPGFETSIFETTSATQDNVMKFH